MLAAGMIAVLVAVGLMLVRALRGPTVFDRLVAANSLGNAAIVILALFGFLTGRPAFPHIARTSALPTGGGGCAALKFVQLGALGAVGEEEAT